MSIDVVVNGLTYPVPEYRDKGWAQGVGNLTQLLVALAAASSGSNFMNIQAVSTTPFDLATAHTYLVDTSTAITLNLFQPVVNTWFMVKDITGLAGTNNIILHRFASEMIDGVAADKTLNITSELCMVVSDGTNWYVLLEI